MDRKVQTVIDAETCTGCGICLKVCPSGTLSMENGLAVVSGQESMLCDHCAAACPAGAIRVDTLDENFRFNTFATLEQWLPHGAFDTARLVQLMRSRRSCRNFTEKKISRAILDDLVRIGTTAPSGTNCQQWTFTILASRPEVVFLGDNLALYFRQLNRMAKNRFLRLWSLLFGNDELGNYFRRYYRMMEDGLEEWQQKGKDRLFHGATGAILVGATAKASCPREDALLATQNILLAAHAMGLGTCLIGFAVAAMQRKPAIKIKLQIPANESIYSVIALGYPDEKYEKVAGRKTVVPRYPLPFS